MKIKSIDNDEYQKYYDNIRHNHNILGIHKQIKSGTENQNKKDYAATVIYALMSVNGYIDEVIQKIEDKAPLEIINAIVDEAQNKIKDIPFTNNSINYQVNNLISFDNNEYLILDVILKDDLTYLYLINNDELKDDIAIVKVKNSNYFNIEDDEEFDNIINKIFIDFRDNIINLLTEE